MLETRILQNETRSLRASNIEVRFTNSHIFIGGSLPLRTLSSPITDKKTGKRSLENKFRRERLK